MQHDDLETLRILDDATRADIQHIATTWNLHPATVIRSMIRSGLAVESLPCTAGRESDLLFHLTAYLAMHGWQPGRVPDTTQVAVILWYHPTGLAAAVPASADTPGFSDLYRSAAEHIAEAEQRPITALADDLTPARRT
ncbi:hypothetical protein [Glycomyces sp. YM15]|uniref:hypothetical protein n=1 Tax=Glycomyces sp. YM15 TaxID=2800446 RepID=UPI0019657D26|nr:hypothetical protein [Glycomyces sp. YM15]